MCISIILFESHRTVTCIIFIARQVMRLRSGNSIQENATTGSNKLGVFDSSCKSNETATLQTTVWIWSKHLYNQCVARYQSYHCDYLRFTNISSCFIWKWFLSANRILLIFLCWVSLKDSLKWIILFISRKQSLKDVAVSGLKASAIVLVLMFVVCPTVLKLFPCIYTEVVFLQRRTYNVHVCD